MTSMGAMAEERLPEEFLWAAGLAARVRLLQASCADDSPASRQQFIAEEIERALKSVLPVKRRSHLDALAERFPSWDTAPVTLAPQPGSATVSPETLLDQLLAVAPELSDGERKEFAERLTAAGLAIKAKATGSFEIPPDLAAKLAGNGTLEPERAMKLLAALWEWTMALDQPVWKIWKQLAPNSPMRRELGPGGDLKALVSRYLAGDPDVSVEQVMQALEKSRRLIAGLLASVAPAANRFAAQYFYRFSPDSIKEMAQMEKGFAGLDQKCWRKYVDLAANYPTPASVEKEVRDIIAKCAEELMLGPTTATGA